MLPGAPTEVQPSAASLKAYPAGYSPGLRPWELPMMVPEDW